jgi:hypothetical protein
LQSVDFPKYDTLKQIVFRINNIGAWWTLDREGQDTRVDLSQSLVFF